LSAWLAGASLVFYEAPVLLLVSFKKARLRSGYVGSDRHRNSPKDITKKFKNAGGSTSDPKEQKNAKAMMRRYAFRRF